MGKKWRSSLYSMQVKKIISEYDGIIFFDTETTGFSKNDYVIELAALKYTRGDNNCFKESARLHLYIKPPLPISAKISELTGITDDFLEDKPNEEDVFEKIKTFFGESPVIVAHNVSFDEKMMRGMYERQGNTFNIAAKIDTLEMARDCVKSDDVENYKLGTLAEAFGLDENISFHSAIDDTIVAQKLFVIFLREYAKKKRNINCNLIKPTVNSIHFWEGYKGFSKIYVNTDVDSFFYDIRTHCWGSKTCDIDTIDMEYVQSIALSCVGATTLEEFSQFKGDKKITA